MAPESPPSTTSNDEDPSLPKTSSPRSLSQAVYARRADFTRPQRIKVKIGSWNVAACPGTDKDIGAWFVDGKGVDVRLSGLTVSAETESRNNGIESVGAQEERRSEEKSTIPKGDTGVITGGDEIGLYVLGLQEIVELSSAKEYLGKIYNDPKETIKWRNAVMEGLPKGYQLVAEQQLSGLLLLIFASPTVAPTITSVSTVGVGTGIMGYLGNKGAVTTRLVIGDTTRLVFVNSHLASGNEPTNLERRCWDVSQILSRTRFDPIIRAGVVEDVQEGIGEEDFAFWFGDLNFRLEGLPGEDIRRLLMLHTRGEYDIGQKTLNKINTELAEGPIVVRHPDSDDDDSVLSTPRTTHTFQSDSSGTTLPDPDEFVNNPHEDPTSLQATIDSLLPHDQLAHMMKAGKVFHDGWREGPITFLPTYKYDVGSVGLFDSSEKKRSPSWCDRILFRTRRDKLAYDGELQERELSRLKDEELKARGIDHAADEDSVLFDYDPENDGADDGADYDEYTDDVEQPDEIVTKEGFIDRIHLDTYTSHQRVLSSDHKPLDAVFTLDYDAVMPDLKAKVQQEVARELDRAENEGRPGVTVIADNSPGAGEVKQVNSHNHTSTDNVEGVDFGEVGYLRRKSRHLTVANTSQVAASFTFVETPKASGVDGIAPSWLSMHFAGPGIDGDSGGERRADEKYDLEPGDSIDVVLEVFIDDIELVRALNNGKTQLDDVLVLRVIDGRDHFVPLHASWVQSCFGYSVQELIRVPEGGVRSITQSSNGTTENKEVRWAAPREIFRLTEAIETLVERVVAEWQMSENPLSKDTIIGWPFDPTSWLLIEPRTREQQKEYVLEALDKDMTLIDAFPSEIPAVHKLELIAETTLSFLQSLKDGIITESLSSQLESEMLAKEKSKKVLDDEEQRTLILDILTTSPNHNISFVFLTSMLSRISSEIAPLTVIPPPLPPAPPSPSPSFSPPKFTRSRTDNSSSGGSSINGSIRSSLSLRRSLSFKPPPVSPGVFVPIELGDGIDEKVEREKGRARVNRRFADLFAPVIVRGSGSKKGWEERRRGWVEVFLRGNER